MSEAFFKFPSVIFSTSKEVNHLATSPTHESVVVDLAVGRKVGAVQKFSVRNFSPLFTVPLSHFMSLHVTESTEHAYESYSSELFGLVASTSSQSSSTEIYQLKYVYESIHLSVKYTYS